jgi:hypothetical protein
MKIYTREFSAALGQIMKIETEITPVFKSPVATVSALPEGVSNDVVVILDTKHLYVNVDGVWVDQGVVDLSEQIVADTMEFLS